MGCAAMGAIHAFRFGRLALVGVGLLILIGLMTGAIRHVHALIHSCIGYLHFHSGIAGIWPKSMRCG